MDAQRELLKIADKVVDALEQLGTQRHEIISHMDATDISILDGDDPLGNWSPIDRYLHEALKGDVTFNFETYGDPDYLDIRVESHGEVIIESGRFQRDKVIIYLPDYLVTFDHSQPWRYAHEVA